MKYYLSNQPCGQDLFDSKSHETIANTIAWLIEKEHKAKSDEREVRAIGIDGIWGSGKSNLIKLLEDKLDKKIYHIYTYDAWGYQTDFQRRSLLENITGFLIDNKLIGKAEWNGRLLQLLSRKRTVGTKVMRGLNPIAKVGSIFALLSPLAYFLISFIPQTLIKGIIWGLLTISAILIVIYLQYQDMKKYGQPITFSSFIHELFVSYLDYTYEKSETKESIEQSIKYETIYDEEPSSRDFRLWMKDIDEELDGKKFILVIDNMDRLAKDKVQELWAAINTLFAEQKYNNIIVIVPFDREHIKYAFSNKDNNYGDDFINKTFNVVYRVPAPMMSDWKKYFAKLWKQVLPNEDPDSATMQVYDVLGGNPTPRNINAFINQIVSIKQIIGNQIPNKYIALYIYGENSIREEPFKRIIEPNYLGDLKFLYQNDPDLPKYIASIYYQLPPDKAIEMVYLEQLRKALDYKDIGSFEQISKVPNFDKLLDNAILYVNEVPNAVLTLENFKDVVTTDHWNCVYKRIAKKEEQLQRYQVILLQHITDKEIYLSDIITNYYNRKDFNAIEFYDAIKELQKIDGINPDSYIKDGDVALEPKDYISYVEHAKEDFDLCLFTFNMDKLDEYLASLDIEALNNLTFFKYESFPIEQLQQYIAHLNELISSNTDALNISVCFDRLKELPERPISTQLNDNTLANLIRPLNKDNSFYFDLIAMKMARASQQNLTAQSPFYNIFNSDDNKVIESVAAVLPYYMNYDSLLLQYAAYGKYPLLKAIAQYVTTNDVGSIVISDRVKLITKYDSIIQALEVPAENLINRLNICDWSDVIKPNLAKDIPEQFYKDTVKFEDPLSILCKTQYAEYLKSISRQEWENHLEQRDKEYRLMLYLNIEVIPCFEAFDDLLRRIVENDETLEDETLNEMITHFERHKRDLTVTFQNVRDIYCSARTDMTTDAFRQYGKYLFKYGKLSDNKNSLRTIFVPQLFDDEDCIKTILSNQEEMKKVFDVAEEKTNFERKIEELLDGNYKDDEQFEKFAQLFGVKKKGFIDKLIGK